MRRVPILFSLLTLAIGLFAFRRQGAVAALLWGLLFAATPLSVIYGSYFIQEALLTCFTLALLLALWRYWQAPSWRGAVALGIILGLMHVTKETAVLHVAAIVLAGVIIIRIQKSERRETISVLLKHLGLAFLVFLALHCAFFSSFFSNPQGIVDGFASFFHYAERSQGHGHEKSMGYYLGLLLPHKREGVRWGELALLLAVGVGLARTLWNINKNEFTAYVALSGCGIFLLYSIIPYKNPWLLLTPYSLLLYAAAVGIADLFLMGAAEKESVRRWSLYLAAAGLLAFLGLEVKSNLRKAVFQYASMARNPYVYMHTTPRYERLLDRLETVGGYVEISVYSPDAAWPLPWHLRDRERVGYWTNLETYEAGSIDLIDTRLLVVAENLASDGGFWELHGLRPNTLLALRASDEIAREWIEGNAEN